MKTLKAWGGDPWGCMQNPIHRKRVRHSYFESDTKIFQICSAVFSKKCQLSILGTHKYNIIDKQDEPAGSLNLDASSLSVIQEPIS